MKPDLPTLIPKMDKLREKLPDIPYLLSVPWPNGRPNPYMHSNRLNEEGEAERGTPFELWEWDKLQYMSLMTGDCERELVSTQGAWVEEVQRLDPWGREMYPSSNGSGRGTPWNGGEGSSGSGNNTVARTGERKKVSFGDYLKKKKDSPNDTTGKRANAETSRPEVPEMVLYGNGANAEK